MQMDRLVQLVSPITGIYARKGNRVFARSLRQE